MLRPNTGINTKLLSLKYTPNTATAVDEKVIRILFIPKVIAEPTDDIIIEGIPTERMFFTNIICGLKPLKLICTSGFLVRLNVIARIAAHI